MCARARVLGRASSARGNATQLRPTPPPLLQSEPMPSAEARPRARSVVLRKAKVRQRNRLLDQRPLRLAVRHALHFAAELPGQQPVGGVARQERRLRHLLALQPQPSPAHRAGIHQHEVGEAKRLVPRLVGTQQAQVAGIDEKSGLLLELPGAGGCRGLARLDDATREDPHGVVGAATCRAAGEQQCVPLGQVGQHDGGQAHGRQVPTEGSDARGRQVAAQGPGKQQLPPRAALVREVGDAEARAALAVRGGGRGDPDRAGAVGELEAHVDEALLRPRGAPVPQQQEQGVAKGDGSAVHQDLVPRALAARPLLPRWALVEQEEARQ
mmetsp:Transcript_37157/g.115615  ORF Transcript_37157/g.115615 Transcript_37157/m.115615 type:complete len:326 (+) Transcript_37157:59-1036(+)